MGHSISRKSHALSSSCNIDHFVVQLILRLRQPTQNPNIITCICIYADVGEFLAVLFSLFTLTFFFSHFTTHVTNPFTTYFTTQRLAV